MQTKFIFSFLFVASVFSGCKKSSDPVSTQPPGNQNVTFENSGTISTQGGTVQVTDPKSKLQGAKIVIPDGALQSNQLIQLRVPTSMYDFENDTTRVFVDCQPNGLVFDKPARITIPYNTSQMGAGRRIYFYDDLDFIWKPIPTLNSTASTMTAFTNHFTTFAVGETNFKFNILPYKTQNGRIAVNVKFTTPLRDVPTKWGEQWRGRPNIEELMKQSDKAKVFIRVKLKEKIDYWADKTIEQKIYQMGFYNIQEPFRKILIIEGLLAENKTVWQSSNLLLSQQLEYFSAEPVLFVFGNTAPEVSKQYYFEVSLYYICIWDTYQDGMNRPRDGIFLSTDNAPFQYSGLALAPDDNNNSIINEYDKNLLPDEPFDPSPSDWAAGQPTSLTLSWMGSDPDGDALAYDVYFGTSSNPTTKVATDQINTSISRSGLLVSTTYYWKVVTKDNKGATTTGPVWRFTTANVSNNAPAVPSNPNPTNASTGVSTSPTLRWACSDPDGDVLTYDVYLETSGYPTAPIATNQTAANISWSGLSGGTTYYWKVVANDSKGATTTGPVWSFTTATPTNNPPAAPSNPIPSNYAGPQPTSLTLSWYCSDPDGDLLTYDVYFGTSNPPTTQVATGQNAASMARSGLANGETYYWKIIAKDSKGASTNGPVWSFVTTSSTVSQELVLVAGGTFQMGSNDANDNLASPPHSVTLAAFYIDKTEITYEKWTDVRNWSLTHGYTDLSVGQNGYSPVGSNNPVTDVSWYDVVKWCNARSEKEGLTPVFYTNGTQSTIYRTGQTDINNDAVKWNANGYRLPTEAEWEFAARGGTKTHGYTYSGSNTVGDVAWYEKNGGTTHSVGQKAANELGTYDMSGNVWEWCWDWYVAYTSTLQTDPKGPSLGTYRVIRGGSYGHPDYMSRAAYRADWYYPSNSGIGAGFRCVRK
ncbi:MAG: SUMF1/EgtB/PvdO family nonheme iron enzyme [bacterium]